MEMKKPVTEYKFKMYIYIYIIFTIELYRAW